MLNYLRIQNFALIRSLSLELGPGLTVLTGETGAGKSIILAAVGLILGQRAASDLIRSGEDQALVEALFDLEPQGKVARLLAESGCLDEAEPDQMAVRRVVSAQGKNRVQIGGGLSTLGLLSQVGPELISIVGQHASQALLNPEQHLLMLDAYGGLEDQRRQVGQAVRQVRQIDQRLADLRQELAQRAQRKDWLEKTVKELTEANLDPDEEEKLHQERDLLANAEQLSSLSRGVYQGLYESQGSILETLERVRGLLNDLKRLDGRTETLAKQVQEAYYLLEDVAHESRAYHEKLVYDPERLDWVEGRLLAIQKICRRHGGEVAKALAALASAQAELDSLATGDLDLAQLEKQRVAALAKALELATQLGARRREAGQRLARAVEEELKPLGLAQCRFETRSTEPAGGGLDTPQGRLTGHGLEGIEFFIAPNPGEGFRRLVKTASGGELSRMLLALHLLTVRNQGAPTLVFDEVDAGVGGEIGAAIGRKLAGLAREAQVLVITHLPQIAAYADQHWAVRKEVVDGRTSTAIQPLDAAGRLEEMGRMLAGPGGPESALEHARSLMAAAAREKAAF